MEGGREEGREGGEWREGQREGGREGKHKISQYKTKFNSQFIVPSCRKFSIISTCVCYIITKVTAVATTVCSFSRVFRPVYSEKSTTVKTLGELLATILEY